MKGINKRTTYHKVTTPFTIPHIHPAYFKTNLLQPRYLFSFKQLQPPAPSSSFLSSSFSLPSTPLSSPLISSIIPKITHRSPLTQQLCRTNENKREQRRAFATSSPSSSSSSSSSSAPQKRTLQETIVHYGKIGLATHIALSLLSLAGWYAVIQFGIIDPTSIAATLGIEAGDWLKSSATTFGLAYLIHKSTVFIRAPISIFCIPIVSHWVNRFNLTKKYY